MSILNPADVMPGQTVCYEDASNPLQVGTVVAVIADRWGVRYAVRWDGDLTVGTQTDLRQAGWLLINVAPA